MRLDSEGCQCQGFLPLFHTPQHLIEQRAEVSLDDVKFTTSYRHDFGKIVDGLGTLLRELRPARGWVRMHPPWNLLRIGRVGLAPFSLETAVHRQTADASAPTVVRIDPRH